MRLVKTLIAFIAFWGVIAVSLGVASIRWLTAQLLRSKVRLAVVSLLFVGAGIAVSVSFIRGKAAQGIPPQPLEFSHATHAGQTGISCLFCHRTASTEPVAGVPPVEQCMFCHRVIGKEKPGVAKLIDAWEQGIPLDWLRINRLPDTAHFDHSAHIRAKMSCSTCHGPVEKMEKIAPVRSLKMADCVSCHRSRSAPTSCATCHY